MIFKLFKKQLLEIDGGGLNNAIIIYVFILLIFPKARTPIIIQDTVNGIPKCVSVVFLYLFWIF